MFIGVFLTVCINEVCKYPYSLVLKGFDIFMGDCFCFRALLSQNRSSCTFWGSHITDNRKMARNIYPSPFQPRNKTQLKNLRVYPFLGTLGVIWEIPEKFPNNTKFIPMKNTAKCRSKLSITRKRNVNEISRDSYDKNLSYAFFMCFLSWTSVVCTSDLLIQYIGRKLLFRIYRLATHYGKYCVL